MSEDVAQAHSTNPQKARHVCLTATVPADVAEWLRANVTVSGRGVMEVVEGTLTRLAPRSAASAAIAAQPLAAAVYQIDYAIALIARIEPVTHEAVAAVEELKMAADALECSLAGLRAAYGVEG